MRTNFKLPAVLFSFLALQPRPAPGITVEDLKVLLDRGEKLTLVDVRSAGAFGRSRLPGAIHIPAHLSRLKELPPLGRVVVYGDDLDPGSALKAAEALGSNPGIAAEVLEGGIGRWEALNQPTSRAKGMEREEVPVITYEQLVAAARGNPGLVLMDVRRSEEEAAFEDGGRPDFPLRVPEVSSQEPKAVPACLGRGEAGESFYLILDGGSGAAEAAARGLGIRDLERLDLPPGFCSLFASLARGRSDLVLVDLRGPAGKPPAAGGPAAPLTDLAQEFPGVRVVREPLVVSAAGKGRRLLALPEALSREAPHSSFCVVIDRGDGSAEEIVRGMKEAGLRRCAVLLGGELSLVRRGKPGRETR